MPSIILTSFTVSKNLWSQMHTKRRSVATSNKKNYLQKCQRPFKCHCLRKYFENAWKWAFLDMSTIEKVIIKIKICLSSHTGITFIQIFLYTCKKYIRQLVKGRVSPQGNTCEHLSQRDSHVTLQLRLIGLISVWLLSHGQKK